MTISISSLIKAHEGVDQSPDGGAAAAVITRCSYWDQKHAMRVNLLYVGLSSCFQPSRCFQAESCNWSSADAAAVAASRCWVGACTGFSRLRLFRWTCGLKAAGEERGNQTRTCWTEQVETEATTAQSSHQAGGPELFSTCSPHPAFFHSLDFPSTSLSLFLTFCLSSLLYFPLSLSLSSFCALSLFLSQPVITPPCFHLSLLTSALSFTLYLRLSFSPFSLLFLSLFLSSLHFSSSCQIMMTFFCQR